MKAEIRTTPEFKPIELTITLESQAEADALRLLFNVVAIRESLYEVFGVSIDLPYSALNGYAKSLKSEPLLAALKAHRHLQ